MPLSNNSVGSSNSLGQVLGAGTAIAAGAEILPRTGMGSWVFYLVLATIIGATAVLVSFVGTRVARRLIK